MAMADEELLWVRIGLGQDVNRFAKSLGAGGRGAASPGGRLLVIERRLTDERKPNKHLWFQVIINPWELDEREPTFDLINIDQIQVDGFTLVDEIEGRFRYDYRSDWTKSRDMGGQLRGWLNEVLDDIHEATRTIKTRPAPRKPSSELRFPHGIMVLEQALKRVADQERLILRTENEHVKQRELHELEEQRRKDEALRQEAERKLAFDELSLTVQAASTQEDLADLEQRIPAVLKGTPQETALLEALELRRQQLKPKPKPMPDWDDPSFTNDIDNNIPNKRKRRKRGIRTFD